MSSIVSCTLRVLCVICFVKSILADESNEGRCPNITCARNVSLNKELGRWYAVLHRNFIVVRCLEVVVLSAVGGNLTYYSLHRDESGAQVRQNFTDISRPNDPATDDSYLINNDEVQFLETWVYFYADSHRCIGAAKCQDTTGSEGYDGKHHHKVTIIICCRNSHPSDEDLQPVFDAMKKRGLDKYKMKKYDQENCPNQAEE